jgi:hypothetical protein
VNVFAWLWEVMAHGGAIAVFVVVIGYLLLQGEVSFRYPRRHP